MWLSLKLVLVANTTAQMLYGTINKSFFSLFLYQYSTFHIDEIHNASFSLPIHRVIETHKPSALHRSVWSTLNCSVGRIVILHGRRAASLNPAQVSIRRIKTMNALRYLLNEPKKNMYVTCHISANRFD